MKFEKLRKYAEIFEFKPDSRFDVFGDIDQRQHQVGECFAKDFGGYFAEMIIFDFDNLPPAAKFLIKTARGGTIEVAFENENLAMEFVIADCNTICFM